THRVIRRQSGVGQRRCLHHIEFAEREQLSCRHRQIRGHATGPVESDTAHWKRLAFVVVATQTLPTAATTNHTVHRDRVTNPVPGNPCSQRFDPACILVSQRHRQERAGRMFHGVQIGVAHPSCPDSDQHFTRPCRRNRDLSDLRGMRPSQLESTHRFPPSCDHVSLHPAGSLGPPTRRRNSKQQRQSPLNACEVITNTVDSPAEITPRSRSSAAAGSTTALLGSYSNPHRATASRAVPVDRGPTTTGSPRERLRTSNACAVVVSPPTEGACPSGPANVSWMPAPARTAVNRANGSTRCMRGHGTPKYC